MQYHPLNEKFQSDLTPGEAVLWTGQPNGKVIFHTSDFALIPFSLLWGGFAIFWESDVLGYWGTPHKTGTNPVSWFMVLWGIPFVVIGQYLIWGRFVFQWWRKKKTFYAVTDKRVLIVDEVWNRKLTSVRLTENIFLDRSTRLDGIGTLRFGMPQLVKKSWSWWGNFESEARPSLLDIDEVERVYAMITNSQARLKSGSNE